MSPGVVRSSRRQARCAHESTITIRSQRVVRRICEACAHVSFNISEEEPSNGRTDNVARETDPPLELIAG